MSYYQRQAEAAEKVRQALSRPSPNCTINTMDDAYERGEEPVIAGGSVDGGEVGFDPWELFPSLYGTYSSDFDEMAIDVLKELQSGKKVRRDLGAEMFREVLCNAELCDYGTSPRGCFPTSEFKLVLPALIEKWVAYSLMQWGGAA